MDKNILQFKLEYIMEKEQEEISIQKLHTIVHTTLIEILKEDTKFYGVCSFPYNILLWGEYLYHSRVYPYFKDYMIRFYNGNVPIKEKYQLDLLTEKLLSSQLDLLCYDTKYQNRMKEIKSIVVDYCIRLLKSGINVDFSLFPTCILEDKRVLHTVYDIVMYGVCYKYDLMLSLIKRIGTTNQLLQFMICFKMDSLEKLQLENSLLEKIEQLFYEQDTMNDSIYKINLILTNEYCSTCDMSKIERAITSYYHVLLKNGVKFRLSEVPYFVVYDYNFTKELLQHMDILTDKEIYYLIFSRFDVLDCLLQYEQIKEQVYQFIIYKRTNHRNKELIKELPEYITKQMLNDVLNNYF